MIIKKFKSGRTRVRELSTGFFRFNDNENLNKAIPELELLHRRVEWDLYPISINFIYKEIKLDS